jgi:hypothetical protein
MKKTTYLMALFFAFYSFAYAQYTAIPDANFEQRLIDDGIDSNPIPDFQILTSEAVAVTGGLNLAGDGVSLGIQDLTGIDAFINITGLDVSYNINLSTGMDLTSNTLLTSIDGTECTILTSVNVTGLTNLTEIIFAKAGLTSLDVTTNVALETLNARKCFLTSLDLSQNSALTSVYVKNNFLTFLDMRNGNNANVTFFDAGFNSMLDCVLIDDISTPGLSTWIIDGNSCFCEVPATCLTISIDETELNTSGFSMYPNPANNTLYITTKTNNAVVNIYNITGKVILTKNLLQGENLINVSRLASGIYLARFESDNKIDTKKLIIK